MLPASGSSLPPSPQQLLDRFQQAWQARPRPTIEDFLTDTGVDRATLLRALIHVDLENRLRAGDQARVEDYLQRFPELADDAEPLMELIVAEYRHRENLGQQPSPAEYFKRFPHFGEQLFQTRPPGSQTNVNVAAPSFTAVGSLPAVVGRYRVDRFLARGGMGEVFRVHDSDFDRPLALKVLQERLRGQADVEERFLHEGRLTGQLQHPGIPPVQELGRLPDGRPYFVMKLVKGRDLHALLRERASPQEK
jgi:eukaryotic-like serine/threonine-protein kinase